MINRWTAWTEPEVKTLLDLWLRTRLSSFQIGLRLNRTEDAVRKKLQRLRRAGDLKDDGRLPANWQPSGDYPNRYRAVSDLTKAGHTTDEIVALTGYDRVSVASTRAILVSRGEIA